MARQLALLVAGVVLAFAVVRAATPRGRAEPEWTFRRRRAEWVTVALAVVTGYLVAVCVVALNVGGVPDPRGAVAFIVLAVVVVTLDVPVLRAVWRRALGARREADDARRAELGPEPEEERRHRGLSGEDLPPTRW